MEQLKCRAKSIEDGDNGWVYGYYTYLNPVVGSWLSKSQWDKHWIIVEKHNSIIKVNPETVGRYTGFYDIKNTPIYEGDIVKWRLNNQNFSRIDSGIDVVSFKQGAFFINIYYLDLFKSDDTSFKSDYVSIQGNYFDNPELIQ